MTTPAARSAPATPATPRIRQDLGALPAGSGKAQNVVSTKATDARGTDAFTSTRRAASTAYNPNVLPRPADRTKVLLPATSPDPHLFPFKTEKNGVLVTDRALTYTTNNPMLRRQDVPNLVPLHLPNENGKFSTDPTRWLFTLDADMAANEPGGPQLLPDWALKSADPIATATAGLRAAARGANPALAKDGAEVWAPEIWKMKREDGSRYYMLLSTIRDENGLLSCAAHFADDPMGTWKGVDQRTDFERAAGVPAKEGLLLRDEENNFVDPAKFNRAPLGLIDMTFFRDPQTGRTFLVWKEDGNDIGQTCRMVMREALIDPDNARIDWKGPIIPVAKNDPDSWQGEVVEGAAFYTPKDLSVRDQITFHVWNKETLSQVNSGVEQDDRQARAAPLEIVDGVPSIGGVPPLRDNAAFAKELGQAAAWMVLSGNECYGENYAMGAAHVAVPEEGTPVVTMLPDPIMDNSHPLLVNSGEVSAGHCSIQYTRRPKTYLVPR